MRLRYFYLEIHGILTRCVGEHCTHGSENIYGTKIGFHRIKWCGKYYEGKHCMVVLADVGGGGGMFKPPFQPYDNIIHSRKLGNLH